VNKYELKEAVEGYLEYCRSNDERFEDCSQAITAMTFMAPMKHFFFEKLLASLV